MPIVYINYMPQQTNIIKKWRTCFKILSALLLISQLSVTYAWQQLSPGIEYQDLATNHLTPWSHIHAFRINLHVNKLALVMAKELAVKYASVDEYSRHDHALIAINGGFFDENFQPLGLRVSNNQQISPLKHISWWGVFYIKNNTAYVSTVQQFKYDSADADSPVEFAVQSGPRLLINGKIPSLKPGRAKRSALGITKEGEVIILVTDNEPLSTTELAQIMQAPPLNCHNALNLDGGSSSQLHAHINMFQLDVHGFSNVSDAIIVKAKH